MSHLRRALLRVAGIAGYAVAIGVQAAEPSLGGCPVFPADNVWNATIDQLPRDPLSDAYVATIGAATGAHADFGTVYNGAPNGIPYAVVSGVPASVTVAFQYAGESDAGPYPLPAGVPIEGGPYASGDRHVLVLDRDTCRLYELFAAYPETPLHWHAGSGAIFDLRSNVLRPATWTSADAAGLPILPGLVRYDEVASGEIAHALRFTAPQTRGAFVWPARHEASGLSGSSYPPMGQRFRLKAGVDIASYGPNVQVILRALKKYGMFLADNGSSWFLSGAPDPRWDDDELHQLGQLRGSDFEAVDESSLMADADSARVHGTPATGPATIVAVEYYRAGVDHYFVTADAQEIAVLDAGSFPGWMRTGETFRVYAPSEAAPPARLPVCRFYGVPQAGLDTHFYSALATECDRLATQYANAWLHESANVFAVGLPDPAGACAAGTRPLYRVFDDRPDFNHRYTTSLAVRNQMVAAGWVAEGAGPGAVAMCVPDA